MPQFVRPSLATIVENVGTDFAARLPGADALTRRSNIAVLARVLSGGFHGLYGFIDWQSRQFLADLADDESLDRHGSLWGINRKVASYAAGTATFSGTPGAEIPMETVVRRSDGREFVTRSFAVIGGTLAVTVSIEASLAGADANTPSGASLSLVSPLLGVASSVVVAGAVAGGADVEPDADYRERILFRLRQPPHGGDAADYVAWVLEVPGVSRAWVFPLENGPGTVVVRFMMDDVRAPTGIPQPADVALVRDHIAARRPVTALVQVAAPVAVPLNVTISGLEPDTIAVQEAIRVEIADFVFRESAPGGTLKWSRLHEAISLAAGELDHSLDIPASNVTVLNTQISVMGTVTFVP